MAQEQAEPNASDGLSRLRLWAIPDPADPRSLPPWFRRAVILILSLVIAMRVLTWAFGQLEAFWVILFSAFFLGLALEPAVNYLHRRGMKRGPATLLVLVGLIGFMTLFFVAFGNILAQQLAQLITSLPGILRDIIEWFNERFGTDLDEIAILESIGLQPGDVASYAANIGLGLLNLLFSALGVVFTLFTILLFAFYFSADGPRLRRSVASLMPPSQQRTFLTVLDISSQKVGGYVVSRGIMAVVSAAFHAVVFWLIDLPYWLPTALWVGIVSQFIPTIGTYLAGMLPVVLAMVSGEWFDVAVVLLAITAYQQVENYYLQPRITAATLEIHAAVAFGSVIVGATLFGAVGALLAIPVVATLQALWDTYGRRYELVDELRTPGEMAGLGESEAGQ